MRRASRRLLPFVVMLAVGACTSVAPSPSPAPTPLDVSGEWQLESGLVDGRQIPLVADHPITLTLDDGRIGGVAACNHYGADVTTDGGRLRIGTVDMTLIGCAPPVMAAESAYLEALARVAEVHVERGQLVLAGPATILRFERPTQRPDATD